MTSTDPSKLMIEIKNGVPFSKHYNDIYYRPNSDGLSGLDESRYVFLEGNNLPDRWQISNREHFVIIETGFGTGLNFLATWQAWENHRQSTGETHQRLHYISIEKHPIGSEDLAVCHRSFAELQPYSEQLIARYPQYKRGFQRLWFHSSNLCLTLCLMDVSIALDALGSAPMTTTTKTASPGNNLAGLADCWYLDGFAPDKNPKMWSQATIDTIAKLSGVGSSLATFTAASSVQRHLKAAGFSVKKRAGFARKREMITATLGSLDQSTHDQRQKKMRPIMPWFQYPSYDSGKRSAIVIGAGIAGCQVAWHLAKRGFTITMIERCNEVAIEASGNARAIIAPKLTALASLGESFYLACYDYVLRQLDMLKLDNRSYHRCGVLQLAIDERQIKRWRALSARADELGSIVQTPDSQQGSAIAGIDLDQSGLYFPSGALVSPKALCQRLIDHENINMIYGHEVETLKRDGSQWVAHGKSAAIASAQTLVVATGQNWAFEPIAQLPALPVYGQTTEVEATPTSEALRVIIDHKGYITPAYEGFHLTGASYEPGISHRPKSAEYDQQNRARIHTYLPTFAKTLGKTGLSHGAARMVSPDRFPYLGAMPELNAYSRDYQDIGHGRHWQDYPQPTYHEGLYVAGAFGSRGFTTAALCAEALASLICNEPSPFPRRILEALHPARFLIKQLKRQC